MHHCTTRQRANVPSLLTRQRINTSTRQRADVPMRKRADTPTR